MAARITKGMVRINEKRTTMVDFYRLRQYISATFAELQAEIAKKELKIVEQMRSDLERPTGSSLYSRRDLLCSYYQALCQMEACFPFGGASGAGPIFSWYDAVDTSRKSSLKSLHFEKACVLFNLAATYSQIALACDRTSNAGLKEAFDAFRAAAGVFMLLREEVAPNVAAAGGATIDVTCQCAHMLETLMLAQAQECASERAIRVARAPGLCSKIAQQVSLYYEETYASLCGAPLNQHFDWTWVSHVQLKAAQFYAEACYRNALDLHDKTEIGEEIARLKIGISAIADVKKSETIDASLIDAVSVLEQNLNSNLERAMKENDPETLIPAASSLSALPAVHIAKPTPITDLVDANKEGLFSGLALDNKDAAKNYGRIELPFRDHHAQMANLENRPIILQGMGIFYDFVWKLIKFYQRYSFRLKLHALKSVYQRYSFA